jgi:hypothetical protein
MTDATSIASLDNLRGFFNEKIDGEFSKSHPLQSALLVSMYCDDDGSKNVIENSIVKLFGRKSSHTSNKKKRLQAYNSDLITNVALKNLRMSSSNSIDLSRTPCSMHYGLELASDLLMIESESDGNYASMQREISPFNSRNLPAPVVNAPPVKPVPVVIRKDTSTQTIVAPAIVPVVIPEKKKGSFQSGKDKFLEDGGKFTAKATFGQNKTTSSSSSNKNDKNEEPLPPELEHCDRALVEKIEAEIVHTGHYICYFVFYSCLSKAGYGQYVYVNSCKNRFCNTNPFQYV